MIDRSTPLVKWLEEAGSRRPAPGGGAVAAVAGALAAAMGEMTLNFSVGRKANSPEAEETLSRLRDEFARARVVLLGLMEEDQSAYLAHSGARKLPEDDPSRQQQLTEGLWACISVPQIIMSSGMRVLGLAQEAAPIANRWLLSDLAVCCELAMAAVRCGSYNVRANLGEVAADGAEGQDEAARLADECERNIEAARGRLVETLEVIARRGREG